MLSLKPSKTGLHFLLGQENIFMLQRISILSEALCFLHLLELAVPVCPLCCLSRSVYISSVLIHKLSSFPLPFFYSHAHCLSLLLIFATLQVFKEIHGRCSQTETCAWLILLANFILYHIHCILVSLYTSGQ